MRAWVLNHSTDGRGENETCLILAFSGHIVCPKQNERQVRRGWRCRYLLHFSSSQSGLYLQKVPVTSDISSPSLEGGPEVSSMYVCEFGSWIIPLTDWEKTKLVRFTLSEGIVSAQSKVNGRFDDWPVVADSWFIISSLKNCLCCKDYHEVLCPSYTAEVDLVASPFYFLDVPRHCGASCRAKRHAEWRKSCCTRSIIRSSLSAV